MTFEQWWNDQAMAGWIMFTNDDGKDIARVAWDAAKKGPCEDCEMQERGS